MSIIPAFSPRGLCVDPDLFETLVASDQSEGIVDAIV